MQIDWFTVGAQIVNFLVLVMLLKHFLYKPVINAMERREQSVAQSKQQAEMKILEAEEQAQVYRLKLQEIDAQKQDLLAKAQREAEHEREQLLDSMRNEVSEIGRRWREEVIREKNTFLTEARQIMGKEIVQLLRKVLADLADVELQPQLFRQFLKRLNHLPEAEKNKFKAMLESMSPPKLKILSSYDLSAEQRQSIVNSLQQFTVSDVELEVEVAPDLLCGLVLQMPGGVLEWNIENYLNDIEDNLMKNISLAENSGRNHAA